MWLNEKLFRSRMLQFQSDSISVAVVNTNNVATKNQHCLLMKRNLFNNRTRGRFTLDPFLEGFQKISKALQVFFQKSSKKFRIYHPKPKYRAKIFAISRCGSARTASQDKIESTCDVSSRKLHHDFIAIAFCCCQKSSNFSSSSRQFSVHHRTLSYSVCSFLFSYDFSNFIQCFSLSSSFLSSFFVVST